jgi:hypothetical protein
MTDILGISAFYHDSAAALVRDGRIIAAAQEERFSRRKHDHHFPQQAIDYCLAEGGMEASALDYVAFYDKPLLKFDRLLETSASRKRRQKSPAVVGSGILWAPNASRYTSSLSHDGRKTLAFRRTLQFNHVRRMLSGIGLHVVWSGEWSSSFQSPRLQAGVVYFCSVTRAGPAGRKSRMSPFPHETGPIWLSTSWNPSRAWRSKSRG